MSGTAGIPAPSGRGGSQCDPMTWEDVLAYCLVKPGAWQDEPWEGDVVAKVGSKIFAFLGSGATPSVGLKCGTSREDADEWLLRYPDDARGRATSSPRSAARSSRFSAQERPPRSA